MHWQLLFDANADSSTVRDCVGALKNMAEYPKVRKAVDVWARKQNKHEQMADMFTQPMYDHKQWPASIRFQHQNVARACGRIRGRCSSRRQAEHDNPHGSGRKHGEETRAPRTLQSGSTQTSEPSLPSLSMVIAMTQPAASLRTL